MKYTQGSLVVRIEPGLGGGGVFIYGKTPRRGALPPAKKKKFESTTVSQKLS